ncbi:MAG: hypothetical protein JWQ29_537, partial [Phenylobacterium sp.]|nr:hypothetical protein [Phenylobacterium sp.]
MPTAAPTHRLTDAHAAMARPSPSGRRREPETASPGWATFGNETSAGIALAPVRPEGLPVPNTTDALKGSWPGMENAALSIGAPPAARGQGAFVGARGVSVLADNTGFQPRAADPAVAGAPAELAVATSGVKRAFDIVAAAFALLLFLPLLVVVMVAIQIESP